MGKKIWQVCLISFLILWTQNLWAEKEYKSKRWRLKFENTAPKSITITEADGVKKTYWFIQYKVSNNTEKDIPWRITIKCVIDQPKEGVAVSQVPGIFYEGRIPEGNKEEYLNNLQAYFDMDLPLVKKAILSHLKLYPKLTAEEKKLRALLTETPKSAMELKQEAGLSYEETESILNNLVVKNLALSQEIEGRSIFLGTKNKLAIFQSYEKENEAKVGDSINDWKIVSINPKEVILQKENVLKSVPRGSTVEFLYSKHDKIIMEQDEPVVTGISAKGTYDGMIVGADKKQKRYEFKNRMIAKNSVVHGLAIFSDVSPDMDFMAIVVTGLVDPVAKRNQKIYIENEVLIDAYRHGKNREEDSSAELIPIYRKEEILSSKSLSKK